MPCARHRRITYRMFNPLPMNRQHPFENLLRCALTASLLCASTAVLAGTRHFEAHCQAPDGNAFVLRAQYQYRHITLGLVSQIHDARDWEIGHRPKQRFARTRKAPASVRFSSSQPPDCSQVGSFNGTLVVSESFLQSDGTWFKPTSIPLALRPQYGDQDRRPPVSEHLERLGVFVMDNFALLVPHKGRLVYERPLLSHGATQVGETPVGAVMHSVSRDNGASWSAPVYTKDAELFVIGKTNAAQPFAARLISHNLPPVKINPPASTENCDCK